MLKIGLIINQYAGIGGKVGLKGSDGEETVRRALELGAQLECGGKAERALKELQPVKDKFRLYTCAGGMGAEEAERYGVPYEIIYTPKEKTTAQDTMDAAKAMLQGGVDLLLFAGGDGTARNILDAVGNQVPVLGIPGGCKIHSAVYAINPKLAGVAVRNLIEAGGPIKTREAEVMDIDEDKFRAGVVSARLYGYMDVPDDRIRMQNLKSGRGAGEKASIDFLANYIADSMEPGTLYLVGSGSTMMAVKEKLGIAGTLLGVDLVLDKKLVRADANERQILDALGEHPKAKVIVTVIGGQGYIFGRGNQQLSAAVLRKVGKDNIIVAMSKDKADSLFMKPLYIDTADEETDQRLSGYYRVVVGYENYVMFKAISGDEA